MGKTSAEIRKRHVSALFHQVLSRARRVHVPYKPGDPVVGDDPYNGRREGVVTAVNGPFVGLENADGTFFYDHRLVRLLE